MVFEIGCRAGRFVLPEETGERDETLYGDALKT